MALAHPDARDFTALRDMYKRYMVNTTVASWLLARDAPSDFQVVRKEHAVQVCVDAAAPAEIVPPSAPDAPFPTSDDLMFLDRNEAGFALGHVGYSSRPRLGCSGHTSVLS